MQYAYSLAGVGEALVKTLKVGATVAAGKLVMRDTNMYGECMLATTTGAADAFGVAQSAGTYATSAEATVTVIINPLAVYRAKCSGAATEDTALSVSNMVLTQTSASTTVITSTAAAIIAGPGNGGLLYCLDGANAGLSRVQTSHVDSTSYTATVAFPNSVAVGDHVLYLPYSRGSVNVQFTTNILQANAYIAAGTGADSAVVDVEVETPTNPTSPTAFVYFVLGDSIYNTVD
jgi:hypothetical protein